MKSIKCYFRLFETSKDVAELFQREFHCESEIELFENMVQKLYTLSFRITDNSNTFRLQTFISVNSIDLNQIGVFVALTTESDIESYSIPEYVMQFYRLIGGSFDISTILQPQE